MKDSGAKAKLKKDAGNKFTYKITAAKEAK